MTTEQLHDALGDIDQELLEEVHRLRSKPQKIRIAFHRLVSIAACAVLLIGIGITYGAMRREMPVEQLRMEKTSEAETALYKAPVAAAGMQVQSNHSAAKDSGAPAELSEPPILTVKGTEESVMLSANSYTWTVFGEKDEAMTVCVDSPAPWELAQTCQQWIAAEDSLSLYWEVSPQQVGIHCYPLDGGEQEMGAYSNGVLTLKKGSWIYAVTAWFPEGEAVYVFRVQIES